MTNPSTQSVVEADRSRVLVVLAHPDDPEFFCGGTIAGWAEEGKEIIYCLLTRGDKGADDPGIEPSDLSRRREAEQRRAANVLGVQEVLFLDYDDGTLVPDMLLRKDIVRIIRKTKPSIIVTCDPTNFFPSDRYINHPDHRAAGHATLDAVFPAAGSGLYFPELEHEEGLAPHKIKQVYVAGAQHPNTTIDVSAFIDRKIQAIREHQSQVSDDDHLEDRIKKRMVDPSSHPESPRYIERFKRIDLR
jgi:LmbE family N-acetylglucosaminyl deacetylase